MLGLPLNPYKPSVTFILQIFVNIAHDICLSGKTCLDLYVKTDFFDIISFDIKPFLIIISYLRKKSDYERYLKITFTYPGYRCLQKYFCVLSLLLFTPNFLTC